MVHDLVPSGQKSAPHGAIFLGFIAARDCRDAVATIGLEWPLIESASIPNPFMRVKAPRMASKGSARAIVPSTEVLTP